MPRNDFARREIVANQISEMLMEETLLIDEGETVLLDLAKERLKNVAHLKKSLDLTKIKEEILTRFDTNLGRSLLTRFGGGTLGVDEVAHEFEAAGYQLKGADPADLFGSFCQQFLKDEETVKTLGKVNFSEVFSAGEQKQMPTSFDVPEIKILNKVS